MKKLMLFSGASALALYLILGLMGFGEAAGKGKPGSGTGSIDPVIVYFANNNGRGSNIMVANADGSNRIVVVDNGGVPSWSPDGQHIIFTSDVDGVGIYRVKFDRNTGQTVGGPVKILPLSIWGPWAKAVWSPKRFSDGKYKIAYVDVSDPVSGFSSVYLQTIEDDGTLSGQPVELRNIPRDPHFVNDLFPSWAPSGDALVVTAANATGGEPDPYDVQIIRLGNACPSGFVCDVGRESLIYGLGNSPLSNSVSDLFYPEWGNHPTIGEAILVERQSDIWIVPVDAPESATHLTSTPDRWESRPSWSPDGSQLIYQVKSIVCKQVCGDTAAIATRDLDPACTPDCEEVILIKEKYPVGDAKWWKPGDNSQVGF